VITGHGRRQGRHPGRGRAAAALALTTLVALVLSACSSGATGGTPSDDRTQVAVPLASSFAGAGTSWAIVAMGHLDDPANTFWQMLYRSEGSSLWKLATPPGVASNGGLVASTSSSGTVTAGFEPSQDLQFSPLGQTADRGASWSQGVLPGALAAVPDALATSTSHHYLALLRTGGGEIVANGGDLTTWTTVARLTTLSADPSTSACRVTGLTAVAYATNGDPLAGTACAHGSTPGIFELVDGAWRSVGPRLPTPTATPTRVLRLLETPAGVAALVSTGTGTTTALVALWSPVGTGHWMASNALPLGVRSLTSTGDTPAGGLVIATAGSGQQAAAVITPSSRQWLQLATPPTGTSAVVAGPDGTLEALIVDQSTLRVDSSGAGGWHRTQTLDVPIQYGSSS